MPFDEPEPTGGVRLYPNKLIGHLLMVWAIEYIAHSPTKYTVSGKLSDVIVVDVVDLDAEGEDGKLGFLCRKQWWRAAQIIASLRPRIGAANPILAHMGQGVATMGNPPFVLKSATNDPEAVRRANVWLAAHPDFTPSVPYQAPEEYVQEPLVKPSHWSAPEEQPTWSKPTAKHQETMLERMARQSAEGAARMPPPRPGTEEPPY